MQCLPVYLVAIYTTRLLLAARTMLTHYTHIDTMMEKSLDMAPVNHIDHSIRTALRAVLEARRLESEHAHHPR